MRTLPSLALTASLGVVGLALAPAASAAPAPSADSVAYLAAQLRAGGDRLTIESGGQSYDDLGLTIDAVLAMAAQGSGGDASGAAADYVLAHAGSYTGSGGEVYSAASAKLLTFASAIGANPRNVGGVDLVAQLQSLEDDNGQFVDQSEWGDYSNTLGQAFGVIGLHRAGVNPSTASVDTLLSQQCDDGGFALEFTDGCVSDPDATSTAIQALAAVGGHDAAVGQAADYLESRQDASGGVGGGATTEGVNANSTGLAAVAFRVAGRDAARTAALGYIDSLTFGCDTPALAGGVAYDKASFDAAVAQGAAATADGKTTRTTAQALLGRTDASYASVSTAGQAAATPALDCATPAPGDDTTDEPTEPATDQPATDEPTTTAPEIPAVVQTDGVGTFPVWPLGLGAAAAGAGLVLVLRRRAVQQH